MEKRLAEVEKESFAAAEKILMGPTVDGCYSVFGGFSKSP